MRTSGILGVVLAAVLTTACYVEIDHCDDPTAAFRDAKREAARFQGRPGPAHNVNVLVYDRDERQLVKVSLPMWIVRKVDRDGDADLDLGGDEAGHAKAAVRRHLNLKEIEKAGLGVIVEVEEDEGDQVLVWLR